MPFGMARASRVRTYWPVGQLAQLILVQPAGHLLAVARDKRDGVAFVEQRDRALDLASRCGS